jgi:hypothetical protein
MKTLNQLISDYISNLRRGKIQVVYKGILNFIGKLRTHFIKNIHITKQATYIRTIWICHIFVKHKTLKG